MTVVATPSMIPGSVPASPLAASVLMAVVLGRTTIGGVRDDVELFTGLDLSIGVVLAELRALRRAGFVDWVDGTHGTIRALVEEVNVERIAKAGREACR
jgi:hypothetical protein